LKQRTSVRDRLETDYRDALRCRDSGTVAAIRMAKAAIQNAEIANRSPLSEDDVMSVLSREVKTRGESLGEFERGGRPELAAKEAQALDVLSRYMPAQLSEEDIRQIVTETIEQLDVTIPTNPQAALGTVMKAVMPKDRGRAGGSAVSLIVRATLHR
jgi:uncharacterized protein